MMKALRRWGYSINRPPRLSLESVPIPLVKSWEISLDFTVSQSLYFNPLKFLLYLQCVISMTYSGMFHYYYYRIFNLSNLINLLMFQLLFLIFLWNHGGFNYCCCSLVKCNYECFNCCHLICEMQLMVVSIINVVLFTKYKSLMFSLKLFFFFAQQIVDIYIYVIL